MKIFEISFNTGIVAWEIHFEYFQLHSVDGAVDQVAISCILLFWTNQNVTYGPAIVGTIVFCFWLIGSLRSSATKIVLGWIQVVLGCFRVVLGWFGVVWGGFSCFGVAGGEGVGNRPMLSYLSVFSNAGSSLLGRNGIVGSHRNT